MRPSPYPYIEKRLIEALDLPLSKAAFSVPTEALLDKLSELFHIEKPTYKIGNAKVIPDTDLENLFPEGTFFERLIFPPLEGELYVITPHESLKDIAHLVLHKQAKEDEIVSRDFLEGMKRFLVTEALVGLNAVKFELASSALIEQKKAPTVPGCLYPLTLTFSAHKVSFHLFATTDFLKSYQVHTKPQKQTQIPDSLKKSLLTEISLEAGQFSIRLNELSSLKQGDFVILDRCSIDPDSGHGNISFCLKQKPLFRGKIKEGKIKVLEYPFDTIGDFNTMNDDPKMPEGFGQKPPEKPATPDPSKEFAENDPDAQMTGDNPWIEQDPSTLNEGSSEDMSLSETEGNYSLEKSSSPIKNPGAISLDVHVELGRLKITAEKLLNLAPGQTLELAVHVDEGVSCMVGDTKVASGQLVKLGDLIGVRLTSVAGSN